MLRNSHSASLTVESVHCLAYCYPLSSSGDDSSSPTGISPTLLGTQGNLTPPWIPGERSQLLHLEGTGTDPTLLHLCLSTFASLPSISADPPSPFLYSCGRTWCPHSSKVLLFQSYSPANTYQVSLYPNSKGQEKGSAAHTYLPPDQATTAQSTRDYIRTKLGDPFLMNLGSKPKEKVGS